MCGIAAIHAYNAKAPPIDRAELVRLKETMHKRGPDGNGEWVSEDGRVGLAHTRLAVIDLSESAAQPMLSIDGNTVISYNGEIYNYLELRRQLAEEGHTFATHSDTEVLLKLYREHGTTMLGKLRGMFAFAIWDGECSTLFCARDPYGIKPLYYSDDGRALRVASQVRTLLVGDVHSREIDPAGQVGFFLFGHIPEPFTLYRSIRALPAGSLLLQRPGRPPRIESYASVAEIYNSAKPLDPRDAPAIVSKAVRDTVLHHLVSDVPVGVFLSSGVDSCVLLALMAETAGRVSAVTLSIAEYQGRRDDEVPLAREAARIYGADHHVVEVGESDVESLLPEFTAAMDQPSIDGFNTWLVSRTGAQCGLKVAVSGLGGDELFGGYPSFRDLPRWRALHRMGIRIPGFNPALAGLFGGLRRLGVPLNPKAEAVPRIGGTWAGGYLARRGLFMPWELDDLLGAERSAAGLAELAPLSMINGTLSPDPGGKFACVSTLESGLYMKNQLLRDADWASMDHSLEVRTPLVDRVLLETLAPALKSLDNQVGKRLLAAVPGRAMPDHWTSREKTGFTLPIGRWLETVSGLDVWKRVPALRSPRCHWARRWAFTVMAGMYGAV